MALIFKSGQEMLDHIQAGNDIYDPSTGRYIWLYNQDGSIACGSIEETKLIELGHEMYETNDDTLVFEELQGLIYDDPSHDHINPEAVSNIMFCNDNHDAGWVDAGDYRRLNEIDLGSIDVDVKLVRGKGYDVYISHAGSSGEHYIKNSADEIGQVVADDIDMYAKNIQDVYDLTENQFIPVPERCRQALLVFTDGFKISYVKHPSVAAARQALKKEYEENFGSLYDKDAGEDEISSEQEMSSCSEDSATLYTGDKVLIWQVIES